MTPSELSSKARVRDINQQANRNKLLADNNGNVYSKADRKVEPLFQPGRRGEPGENDQTGLGTARQNPNVS